MKERIIVTILLLVAFIPALAVLPPDAGARSQQILRERQQKIEEFEEAARQRDAALLQHGEQVRLQMATPPWDWSAKDGNLSDDNPEDVPSKVPVRTTTAKESRTALYLSLLLLITVASTWVVRVIRSR